MKLLKMLLTNPNYWIVSTCFHSEMESQQIFLSLMTHVHLKLKELETKISLML